MSKALGTLKATLVLAFACCAVVMLGGLAFADQAYGVTLTYGNFVDNGDGTGTCTVSGSSDSGTDENIDVVIPSTITGDGTTQGISASTNLSTYNDGSVAKSGVVYTVTKVGNYAFHLNAPTATSGPTPFATASRIRSVVVPNTVTSIGNYAFACKSADVAHQYSKLASVTFEDPNHSNLAIMGVGAFRYALSLEGFVFPAKLANVPSNAFCMGVEYQNALAKLVFLSKDVTAPTFGPSYTFNGLAQNRNVEVWGYTDVMSNPASTISAMVSSSSLAMGGQSTFTKTAHNIPRAVFDKNEPSATGEMAPADALYYVDGCTVVVPDLGFTWLMDGTTETKLNQWDDPTGAIGCKAGTTYTFAPDAEGDQTFTAQYTVKVPAAAIGETNGLYYASVPFSAVQDGGTVTIQKDATLTKSAQFYDLNNLNKTCTLDLAGHTLTFNGVTGIKVFYETLHIISSKPGGKIVVNIPSTDTASRYGVYFDYGASGSIGPGVTVIANGPMAFGVGFLNLTAVGRYPHVDIDGATIDADIYAITGSGTDHNTTMTIKNSTIGSERCHKGIFHPQNGNLTISDTTIMSHWGAIEMRAGNLTLNNCICTSAADDSEFVVDESHYGQGATVIGAAIALSEHTTCFPINCTINGGEFYGTYGLYETWLLPRDHYTYAPERINVKVNDAKFYGGIHVEDDEYFVGSGQFKEDLTSTGYLLPGLGCQKSGDFYNVVEQHSNVEFLFGNFVEDGYGKGTCSIAGLRYSGSGSGLTAVIPEAFLGDGRAGAESGTFNSSTLDDGTVATNGVVYKVTSIDPYAFCSYGDLQIGGLTSMSDLSHFDSFVIPNGVTTIGTFAFGRVNADSGVAVKSVTFQDPEKSKLESIGANAFSMSEISEFIVPAGVRSIGTNAFKQVSASSNNLTDLCFLTEDASLPSTVGNLAFAQVGAASGSSCAVRGYDSATAVKQLAANNADSATAGANGGRNMTFEKYPVVTFASGHANVTDPMPEGVSGFGAYKSSITLPDFPYFNYGYDFVGWSHDGGVTVYAPGDQFPIPPGGDVTISGMWVDHVKFDTSIAWEGAVVVNRTTSSITINPAVPRMSTGVINDCIVQYAIGTSANAAAEDLQWQDSTVFEGLDSNINQGVTYYVYARIVEDYYYLPAMTAAVQTSTLGTGRVDTPEAINVTLNNDTTKLSTLTLPSKWAWDNGNQTLLKGTHSFAVTYTPTDADDVDYTQVEGYSKSGNVVKISRNVTVNVTRKYVVTFAKGASAVTGTVPATQELLEGQTLTIPPCGLAYNDYVFQGWKCSYNGTLYAEGNTLTMPASDMTITAEWKIQSHISWESGLVSSRTSSRIVLNQATVRTGSSKVTAPSIYYAKSTTNVMPSTTASGWQTSTTFSGLNSNTTYYFFARVDTTTSFVGSTTGTTGNSAKTMSSPGAIATPTVADRTYQMGVTLADVTLPSGWVWSNPSQLVVVNNSGYQAYLPVDPSDTYYDDVDGYNASTSRIVRTVSIRVEKATPVVSDVAASDITYWESLADSELTYTATLDGQPLAGSLDWVLPTSTEPNAGTEEYSLIFTPNDTNNINTVDATVEMTTNKRHVDSEDAAFTDDVSDITYNGSAFTPGVAVTVSGRTLSQGSDYTVEYADNKNAGTATVSFSFSNNFEVDDPITLQFVIKPYYHWVFNDSSTKKEFQLKEPNGPNGISDTLDAQIAQYGGSENGVNEICVTLKVTDFMLSNIGTSVKVGTTNYYKDNYKYTFTCTAAVTRAGSSTPTSTTINTLSSPINLIATCYPTSSTTVRYNLYATSVFAMSNKDATDISKQATLISTTANASGEKVETYGILANRTNSSYSSYKKTQYVGLKLKNIGTSKPYIIGYVTAEPKPYTYSTMSVSAGSSFAQDGVSTSNTPATGNAGELMRGTLTSSITDATGESGSANTFTTMSEPTPERPEANLSDESTPMVSGLFSILGDLGIAISDPRVFIALMAVGSLSAAAVIVLRRRKA